MRGEVFHKDDDYAAFLKLLVKVGERLPMRLLAYCLLPNHSHLVLWLHKDEDLSRWMQWVLTSHVRRYHRHYDSSGTTIPAVASGRDASKPFRPRKTDA